MGFSLGDLGKVVGAGIGGIGSGSPVDEALRGFDDKVLGGDAADAALSAAGIQAAAGREASALFDPFQVLGTSGIEQAGFLTDPQQQFDLVRQNPFFDLGLENLNQQTQRSALAQGRGGATDTNQQLLLNPLLAAQPLIQQQKGSILDLLNIGQQTASAQGNLRTGIGAAEAGGTVGAANAQQQGVGNLLNILAAVGGGV